MLVCTQSGPVRRSRAGAAHRVSGQPAGRAGVGAGAGHCPAPEVKSYLRTFPSLQSSRLLKVIPSSALLSMIN